MDEGPSLPKAHTAQDIDFHAHEWVCPHCIHKRHDFCEHSCPMCNSPCLCPCERWRIPLRVGA